jgi:hypothetical protein
MNRFLIAFLAFAGPAFATDSRTEAVREIGSALGWRLGPAAIEEHCRAIDPDGDAARHAAVKIWQQKNEKLIKSVDAGEAGDARGHVPGGESRTGSGHLQGGHGPEESALFEWHAARGGIARGAVRLEGRALAEAGELIDGATRC